MTLSLLSGAMSSGLPYSAPMYDSTTRQKFVTYRDVKRRSTQWFMPTKAVRGESVVRS